MYTKLKHLGPGYEELSEFTGMDLTIEMNCERWVENEISSLFEINSKFIQNKFGKICN